MNTDAAALFAHGYAAAHQLDSITFIVDHEPGCAPARVYHDSNTIVMRAEMPLDRALVLMQQGLDALCPATVVDQDDGGTAWASDVEAGDPCGLDVPAQQRTRLRLVR